MQYLFRFWHQCFDEERRPGRNTLAGLPLSTCPGMECSLWRYLFLFLLPFEPKCNPQPRNHPKSPGIAVLTTPAGEYGLAVYKGSAPLCVSKRSSWRELHKIDAASQMRLWEVHGDMEVFARGRKMYNFCHENRLDTYT